MIWQIQHIWTIIIISNTFIELPIQQPDKQTNKQTNERASKQMSRYNATKGNSSRIKRYFSVNTFNSNKISYFIFQLFSFDSLKWKASAHIKWRHTKNKITKWISYLCSNALYRHSLSCFIISFVTKSKHSISFCVCEREMLHHQIKPQNTVLCIVL